ncbi:Sad1-interacting factor 3 [Coniosporium apollinis]|uniref:Sad1-interacting factor 3 n=1 Tax=Coniosporium apollinis TaxID=61459 RepID=A0ABQ9P1F2_9PEZI|nr:Sad1-interacting factor 3 [Coniosporium apollinis]
MASPNTRSKRGPAPPEPQNSPRPHRQPHISVDTILGYASEIPSAQRRHPPGQRPTVHTRTPSGRHPLNPRLAGQHVFGAGGTMMAGQHGGMPARTSKVSEKLVWLPEAEGVEKEEGSLDGREDDEGPPDDEEVARRKAGSLGRGPRDKSYAERLPKGQRTEKLARVTAYCTAQSYRMRATAEFVRAQHAARTKLYDDCLYCVYHLPLLAGSDGYRVRSSPVLKSPGGKSVLDEEIERNERGGERMREGYFGEEESYGVMDDGTMSPRYGAGEGERRESTGSNEGASPGRRSGSPPRIPPDALQFAEMFVFSYGVVVFWNFTERQEKDILADLTFSSSLTSDAASIDSTVDDKDDPAPTSLADRPLSESDFETEEFHFEYNPSIPRPRVYNDMITLKSGDHMIKLSMSHAIAQSTKLSFFEERMAETMQEAQHVPRNLALTGHLGMKREEVVRILGRLFGVRVEVNLSSNMLDVPNFFWDSEPTLHPLYSAVREYLEIKPRIQVLNERCQVFLDLAEILSDSIADKKMTRITWIIIILIILSILVTCSEVFLRFGILSKSGHKPAATACNCTQVCAAMYAPKEL